MDICNNLLEKIVILNSKIDDLYENANIKANAEYTYRVALATFMAEKIALGNKVSVLADLARGDKTVASLRLNRDMKVIIWENTQEKIYAIKTEIRVLENILKLEYNRRD